MAREVTQQERETLLKNPQLVMFDPYSAFRHGVSLGKALIPPLITVLLLALWAVLYPGFVSSHPKLFAGLGCAALVIASGSLPVLYHIFDDLAYSRAKAGHFGEQLEKLMPQKLNCSLAHIDWVTVQKAEGGWVIDGRDEMFGYVSYVNCFPILPGTDLAVIRGRNGFTAFVKRDEKTESFYR